MEWFNLYQLANCDSESIKKSFIVRKMEFHAIINTLAHRSAKDSLQHELILGKKGSGKSTLLRMIEIEIERELSRKYIPVYLAEEQASIYRSFDLWLAIIEELKRRFSFQQNLKDYLDFNKEQDYTRYLYRQIHDFCAARDKQIVLLLDNFDRIAETFIDDEDLLLEILINYDDLIFIAASTRIDEEFWKEGKPFHEFFRWHILDALTIDEIEELFNHWARTANMPELKKFLAGNPGKLQDIRFITDGSPRTFQLLIQLIIQSNYASEGVDYLKMIIDSVTPLYQERLYTMPPQLRKIVMEMAFIWEASTTKELVDKCRMESKLISANLKTLSQRGIVEKIETDNRNLLYRISDRFFNIWLIMTQGNSEQKRKIKLLNQFLEKWYDTTGLKGQKSPYIEIRNYKKGVEYAVFSESENDGFKSFDLGTIYRVQTVYSETEKYFLSAIGKGQVSALYNLGNFYVSQGKYDEAEKYYLMAMDKGHIGATYNLGVLYAGQGKHSDAEKYYISAVERGDVSAMYNLGVYYINHGKRSEAEKYFYSAAEKGDVNAIYNLGNLYSNQKKYSEAERYYKIAIEKGHINALNNLGNIYANQNKYSEAEQYYRIAIEKGHVGAMSNLGILHSNRGDFIEAENCYLSAIGKEFVDALYNLGILYYTQDKLKEAEKYYLLAIGKGHDRAMYNLGILYDGWGRFIEAERYYLSATEKNDNNAFYNLASLYYHQNKKKADALKYICHYEGCEDLRIIIELWNGVFNNVEKRTAEVVLEEPDTLSWFIIDLLIHQQGLPVLNLFNHPETGQSLQERYKILHYVCMLLNKNTGKNLSLKIPPEIQTTINNVIDYIDKKGKIYGYSI